MRWHLLVEEFGPTITYVKGQHNIVADALICMNRTDFSDEHNTYTIHHYAECFGINDLPNDTFPLTYELIDREEQKINNFYYYYKIINMLLMPFVEVILRLF